MFEFQSHLIFPVNAVPRSGLLPLGAERLSLATPDGHKLEGVHIPAGDPAKDRTLILGFGGNAWNGQDVAEYLHELFPASEVVAFHYRGYTPSTGSPSANALLADAPLVYDLAVERVRPERVVAVGFSIGSGIAASLAAERQVDGLILVTPFDSLKALAQSMYPWLPIGRFFEHEIDAAAVLEKVRAPVAIIAAEQDEIVPPERTEALRPRIRRLFFDHTIERAGHNDIYARSDFHEAMREAFAALANDK
jgi:pimeloyl-ACP methyl ester carboxylesterase